jgi:hypothetical protein
MKLFTELHCGESVRRLNVIEELELLWKRVRRVALFAPLLLVVGFGTGKVTNRALELPEATPARQPTTQIALVHLDALSRTMERLRGEGVRTAEVVSVYREHVEPVERVLRRRGMSRATARETAWPLVEQSYKNRLDVATVLSIIFLESNFRPNATSSVGARGLMQVMPAWAGRWRGCGRDLYAITDNLCNGTSILAYYLRTHKGDERRALLGYNGCVRGTVTRNCHTYPDKVARVRSQMVRELTLQRTRPAAEVIAAD